MRYIFALFMLGSLGHAQDFLQPANFGSLYFSYERGGKIPPPQTLSLGSEEHRTIGIVSVSNTWLHAVASNDGNPDALTFSVDPTGLAPGIYEGSLLFNLGDSDLGTANTRLTIADPAKFITIPTSLNFVAGSPATQMLYVTAANQPVAFKATASPESNWLAVTPSQGNTPANLIVYANPAGLAGGAYNGSIKLSSAGAPDVTVPVTLTVAGGVPRFTAGRVLNAASQQPGPIAPGELITILDVANGPIGFMHTPGDSAFAATTLFDTRLLFDGTPVPLLSVATGEVRAMVPFELDGATSTTDQLEYLGQKSAPVSLRVAPAQPGIFTTDLSGKGQVVATFYEPGGTLPSQNKPGSGAPRGGILAFFITGGGQLIPSGRTGSIRGGTGLLKLPVQATIGGKNAEVLYAGAAPGLQEGVSQLNLRVPMDSPTGDAIPIAVTVNGTTSPAGPTAAIK